MSDDKGVPAELTMELNVECPECGYNFDLFKARENNDGQLYDQVIKDERWEIDANVRLRTHVDCPECGDEFFVKGVEW